MTALAYILLPVSGLAAFLLGANERMRFHGLQAIALGLVWAAALYGASVVSPMAARVVFGLGAAVWLGFMVLAGIGSDPKLPVAGAWLERVAASDPRAG